MMHEEKDEVHLKQAAPCPFCKTNQSLYIGEDKSEDDDEDPRTFAYHVGCGICGAKGRNRYPIGWCETPEQAVEAWNDRGEPMLSQDYHLEPLGPEGQFALYNGRTPRHPGQRLCLMYDFGYNRVEAHRFRTHLVELLNGSGKS